MNHKTDSDPLGNEDELTINNKDRFASTNKESDKYQPDTNNVSEESDIDIKNAKRLEDVTIVLLNLYERFRWETAEKSEKARYYPHPFILTENLLESLDQRVNEWMSKCKSIDSSPLFTGEVRFADLSSIRFSSLSELIKNAGHKRDPESLKVMWSIRMTEPIGSYTSVEVEFKTDKTPEAGALNWFNFPQASINLKITGPDSEWVDKVFDELDPFFMSARIGGIYKPLLAFRNSVFVYLISFSTGFIAQTVYYDLLSALQRPKINKRSQDLINQILSKETAEGKLDIFFGDLYSPNDSPLFTGVIEISGGMIFFLFVVILSYMLYPKLVPRSGINIGLAATRFANYANVFRLVIVTIILSGFLIPFIRAILFQIW